MQWAQKKRAGPKSRPGRVAASRVSTIGYLPVPDRATFCGLSGALSVNVRLPLRTPVCVGVKLTFTMQLAPAATVLPLTQGCTVLVALMGTRAKSPLVATVVMLRATVPELVTVTFFLPGAVVPTAIFTHLSEVGFRLTTGLPVCDPARAVIRAGPIGLPQPVPIS